MNTPANQITQVSQIQWLDSFKQSIGLATSKGPDALDLVRQRAGKALASEPVPFRKMERWRYTPVDGLFKLPLNIVKSAPANDRDFSDFFTLGLDSYRFIIADGKATFLGDVNNLPAGVTLTSMHTARQQQPELLSRYAGKIMNHEGTDNGFQTSGSKKDSRLFQHLNQSALTDGIFIHIPEGVKLEKPVEVLFVKTGDEADLIQTHNVIVLENKAEMTLIENHASEKASDSFSNNQFEIDLQNQSRMKHYFLQNQHTSNWFRQGIHRTQSSESHYQGWFGCCGSHWSRLELNAFFTGENAVSDIKGIQLGMDGQVNDIHMDIRHDLPHCQSEQHFRGLVSNKSKIVFDGNITVSKDAQKTVAHLSDNNLMLTRNTEVDAKPQLEIYADDVQCSHGTSIGELDEQQVFYLRSRGIDENHARSLLSLGFVAELIENIELEEFRQHMLDLLDQQLRASQRVETVNGSN